MDIKLKCFLTYVLVSFFQMNGSAQPKQFNGLPKENFRGLEIIGDGHILLSGTGGTALLYHVESGFLKDISPQGMEREDFRSCAATNDSTFFLANVGAPGIIIKSSNRGETWDTVWYETHSEVFLDGIAFWNENRGLAYGDVMDGYLLVLITENSGRTWRRVEAEKGLLAKHKKEGSFAASNSGILLFDENKAALAYSHPGGNRILLSSNGGDDWGEIPTNMRTGEASGTFAIAQSDKRLVLVGGNYTQHHDTEQTAAYLLYGENIFIPAAVMPKGYRSGVACEGSVCVATGRNGTDISYNGGMHWEKWLTQSYFAVRISAGNVFLSGGNGKFSILPIKTK